MTPAQYAAKSGKKIGAVEKAWRRKRLGAFDRHADMSAVQMSALNIKADTDKRARTRADTGGILTATASAKKADVWGAKTGWRTWAKDIELDAVIWATTATTVVAVLSVFGWWGLPVSVVYVLVLFSAMRMAADPAVQKTAENGAAAVIVFEMLAACAHTYIFNLVIWERHKSLPFEIRQEIVEGKLDWVGGWIPFTVAATVGVLLSGSAVFAIVTKIQITRERFKAQ